MYIYLVQTFRGVQDFCKHFPRKVMSKSSYKLGTLAVAVILNLDQYILDNKLLYMVQNI